MDEYHVSYYLKNITWLCSAFLQITQQSSSIKRVIDSKFIQKMTPLVYAMRHSKDCLWTIDSGVYDFITISLETILKIFFEKVMPHGWRQLSAIIYRTLKINRRPGSQYTHIIARLYYIVYIAYIEVQSRLMIQWE